VFDVGGEPTSVDVLGNRYALVAVNTSPSFAAPSGRLKVYDLSTLHEAADLRVIRRVASDGRLYLGVNDGHLDDNRGQYRVTVTIE
jgi:hypothetical protein